MKREHKNRFFVSILIDFSFNLGKMCDHKEYDVFVLFLSTSSSFLSTAHLHFSICDFHFFLLIKFVVEIERTSPIPMLINLFPFDCKINELFFFIFRSQKKNKIQNSIWNFFRFLSVEFDGWDEMWSIFQSFRVQFHFGCSNRNEKKIEQKIKLQTKNIFRSCLLGVWTFCMRYIHACAPNIESLSFQRKWRKNNFFFHWEYVTPI